MLSLFLVKICCIDAFPSGHLQVTASNARFAKEPINILEEAVQQISSELAAMGRGAPPPSSGKFVIESVYL